MKAGATGLLIFSAYYFLQVNHLTGPVAVLKNKVK